MLIPKITGTMIRAGRIFTHLSQDQLAARAGIHRDCLRTWEGSSDSVPRAQYRTLCRLIDALESEGVRFSEDGVRLHRPASIGTVIHSEGAMA
jgi:transcriptional regulator with XRE-family HTH domain